MGQGTHSIDDLPPDLSRRIVHDVERGCWLWSAGTTGKATGYGFLRRDGQRLMVHRLVYTLLVGPIPEALVLDHLCSVRRCCAPDHLEPVTIAENTRRAQTGRRNETCLRGHPQTPENTRTFPSGQRHCLLCNKIRGEEWRGSHVEELRERGRLRRRAAGIPERKKGVRLNVRRRRPGPGQEPLF